MTIEKTSFEPSYPPMRHEESGPLNFCLLSKLGRACGGGH